MREARADRFSTLPGVSCIPCKNGGQPPFSFVESKARAGGRLNCFARFSDILRENSPVRSRQTGRQPLTSTHIKLSDYTINRRQLQEKFKTLQAVCVQNFSGFARRHLCNSHNVVSSLVGRIGSAFRLRSRARLPFRTKNAKKVFRSPFLIQFIHKFAV